MSNPEPEPTPADHGAAVRSAFAAALNGELDAVASLLAEDVRWHAADCDPDSGCTSRHQALAWMSAAVGRGVRAEVLEVSAVDENRVLVRLRRRAGAGDEQASPHAQIVTFRGGKVVEILVYPSEDEAIKAAGGR